MKTSDRGIALIKSFEGMRAEAYLCPAKVWTIGYGHTGPDVHRGLLITRATAEEMLRADLMRFEEGVEKSAGACTQNQFDALVSFTFNLGLGAFRSSTLLKKHKAGDFAGAAEQFGKWINAGGKPLDGLRKRRAAEADLYRS